MARRIYAADDERNIRNLIKTFLEREGYDVEAFATGDDLLEAFRVREPDLVILDIMMPGLDGFEVCSRIRETSTVPIIMLTARDTDASLVTGITLGSDEYFTKPFSPLSLVMRVKAIFRRMDLYSGSGQASAVLEYAGVRLDPDSMTVTVDEEELDLSPNEFSLLSYLMKNPQRAVPREELLDRIWGYETAIETRVADDTVKRLRRKIADTRMVVETVWGYGFRLRARL
ncbi:MAG TPA: response regulator transcription factor [Clostridia bacterium]